MKKCSKCGTEYNPMYMLSIHRCATEKKQLGFGWGNIWIVLNLLLGALVLLLSLLKLILALGGFLTTTNLFSFFGGFMIFVSIIGISSAIGLLKKKAWGLYLVYVALALFVFNGLITFVYPRGGEPESRISWGIIFPLISYPWFKYFYRRKDWFKGF